MKKVLFFSVLILLVFSTFQPVSAQIPASYQSTVIVTNVTNGEGNIFFDFFDSNGEKLDSKYSDTIGAFETKTITTFGALSKGFSGSSRISSDVPLATMSTIQGKNSSSTTINYAGYIGTTIGSDKVYLPLLMKDNYGYNSYFFIQNIENEAVTVEITYSDGTNRTETILPQASMKIDNRLETHNALHFSATLTVTEPVGGRITAAVVEYSTGQQGNQLYAYGGFIEGSTKPIFPMINENNYGYWTSANIQNIGVAETVVTVEFTPTEAGKRCTETQTIPPGEKRDFATYAFAWPASMYDQSISTNCSRYSRFIGTAVVIENSSNQPLVGIVNQINNGRDPHKGQALMSLNPDTATPVVVFPNVQQWVGSARWWSSWNVINVSSQLINENRIECRVIGTADSSGIDIVITNPYPLEPGQGWLKQNYDNYPPLPNGFIGGAICRSLDGHNIVGSSNVLGAQAGYSVDSAIAYEGINVSP